MKTAPLVSLAIPLYHSLQFLANIIANIEKMSYPNLEIIISDRHTADDTIERLKIHFAKDTRFQFVAAKDEINWIAHYNKLLKIASGTYFLWMPHDDIYPPNYITNLVTLLEQNPNAIVAAGGLELIDMKAAPLRLYPAPPTLETKENLLAKSLNLLQKWDNWILFRGVFRRTCLIEQNLFIKPSYRLIYADVYWIFGLLLLGDLCYAPSIQVSKTIYIKSATRQSWRDVPFFINTYRTLDGIRLLSIYLWEAPLSLYKKLTTTIVLYYWSIGLLIKQAYKCLKRILS